MQDYKLGYLIKKIHQTFETEINHILKDYGITKTQSDVLMYLCRHQNEEVMQKDIEHYFGITNPTVTGILNRLSDKNLIKRVSSNKDARCNCIVITDNGLKIQETIRDKLDANERMLVKGLSDEEIEILNNLLKRLFGNISA